MSSKTTGTPDTDTQEIDTVSGENKKPNGDPALSGFSVTGPRDESILRGAREILVESMLGVDKKTGVFNPVVMLTLIGDGKRVSFPMSPDEAISVGSQCIESAAAANHDATLIKIGRERGTPMSDLIELLQAMKKANTPDDD